MRKAFLALFLALAALLSACSDGVAVREATPTPFPTPLRDTFTVQRGDMLVEVPLYGRVAQRVLAAASFEIPGKVSAVYAQAGDMVEAGQLLAELEELKGLNQKADEIREQIRRAQIALEIEQLALEKARAENLPAYDVRVQELKVELAQMDYQAALARLGLDPAVDAFGQLDAQVAKARLYAPLGGTVLVGTDVGRQVSPNTPSFVIGDASQLEVIALIEPNREKDLEQMFEGMSVVISPDARPDVQLSGKIRQMPAPYGTGPSDDRSIYIRIDQAPGDDTYQVGEKMTVKVTLADKKGVLWLPPAAVRTSGGRTFVIINSPEGPRRLEVETGLRTNLMVEIISGLDEGQVVVAP
jgi:HlyD family secretion protein